MVTKTLIFIVIGIVTGSTGTLAIAKLIKPNIKVECPSCPDMICPEQKPCNGIDFDKIKSKNITIQNDQHLTVTGDSLLVDRIVNEIKMEMRALKLSKCK